MKRLGCFLLGALLFLPSWAGAQVFKCVDERGRTYYTDKPGPRCKGGSSEPASKAATPGKASSAQQKSTPPQAKQPLDKLTLEQRCAALRREITRVATSRRVAEVGAKGEVTFRDDPARERRLAELQEEMRQCR